MTPFSYGLASTRQDALAQTALDGARFLGGGTNLVDLLRQGVEHTSALVDVSRLACSIEETPDGGLLIGAGVRNAALAADRRVRTHYPLLSRALLAGASAQIRNMATVGGNLLQRTRCTYFYDVSGARCNKRAPGSGCDALGGFTRYHAILGASERCVATHPSDMAVAMVALDARVHLEGKAGSRSLPLVDLHRLPGDTPHIETELQPGELITAVEIPSCPWAANSTYRKVRDRSSYAFALVSVAAALEVVDGSIADVRIALGGVAPKPWRARHAETLLRSRVPGRDAFLDAADAELAAAAPLEGNAFKIPLVRNTMAAVLGALSGNVA
jgi:xanthine dehydrogenase YagS FAD-binding subunit